MDCHEDKVLHCIMTLRVVWSTLCPLKMWHCHQYIIFKRIVVITFTNNSGVTSFGGIADDPTDDESSLVQIMVWCRQASSLCLELCWEDKHVRHIISSSKWEASIYANAVIFSVPVSEFCVEMIGRIMGSRSYSLVCTFNHNIIIIQNCISIEHIKRSVVRYALFGVRQDKSNYLIYLLCSIWGSMLSAGLFLLWL